MHRHQLEVDDRSHDKKDQARRQRELREARSDERICFGADRQQHGEGSEHEDRQQFVVRYDVEHASWHHELEGRRSHCPDDQITPSVHEIARGNVNEVRPPASLVFVEVLSLAQQRMVVPSGPPQAHRDRRNERGEKASDHETALARESHCGRYEDNGVDRRCGEQEGERRRRWCTGPDQPASDRHAPTLAAGQRETRHACGGHGEDRSLRHDALDEVGADERGNQARDHDAEHQEGECLDRD